MDIPEKHRHKLLSPENAFGRIGRGDTVFISSGCAEPQHLVRELIKSSDRLAGNEIIHILSLGPAGELGRYDAEKLRLNSIFVGEKSRKAIEAGRADYTPAFLSEIPRMIRSGSMKIDVALIQVAPPDHEGYCNLGISVEVIKPAAEAARYVIAQINPRMPRTYGDTAIHLDRLDALVPMEEPLIEYLPDPPNDRAVAIGMNVARIVEDGATLQIGIGKIPNGILHGLSGKKNLGVHTEMFSDGILDLIRAGTINNRDKTLHPGKTIAAFCMGTKKLYDFISHNPMFEFYSSEYVSDPFVIGQNRRMTSVNSAIEIDLTGQVCADSLGGNFISGFGSQPDFVRGSKRSEGGKSIIVLPSTARNDSISRISVALPGGAGVVTTRGDVQYVVTEYGIANLEGRCIRARALALIEIAHPRFREKLLEEAKRTNYLFQDQTLPPVQYEPTMRKWDTPCILKDGTMMRVRPILPSDERALQKFKYALSDGDVFLRFMSTGKKFTHTGIQPLTVIDYFTHMALVAVTGSPGNEDIIGVARYFCSKDSPVAEIAFTVKEKWRRRGVGTCLLRLMTDIAREHGIVGFKAEILSKNRAMMRLFNKSECTIHSSYDEDIFSVWYKFDE
jgi:acyl-CoA hydrolase/GNAT superfamily N-acetyltransferase